MSSIATTLPDSAALGRALFACMEGSEGARGTLRVLDRKLSALSSTFPAEVVTCETTRGSVLKVWCKYADGRKLGGVDSDRRLEYEARLYRDVLPRSPVPAPLYHGFYRHPDDGWAYLVLEYVEDSLQLSKRPEALTKAAEWIGRFHAWSEVEPAPPWLGALDAAYYEERMLRSERLSEPWHERYPGLATLHASAGELVEAMLSSPRVVVHGEFYPGNILIRSGAVLPIDWESAAFGAGEIDLAALTESWGPAITEACVRAYVRTRWGGVEPASFARRLHAARALWYVRWLAQGRYWKPTPKYERRVRRRIERLLALLDQ